MSKRSSVAVIDYGAGNLRSVQTALKFIGAEFSIASNGEEIKSASRLIFPGVGDASAALSILRERGLVQSLIEYYQSGRPFLGICLGCQIIFDYSEEGQTRGLGLIPGVVRRFPGEEGLKVPHMGWNRVDYPEAAHPLLRGIAGGSFFYFVHSYYPVPQDKSVIIAETEYGLKFSSGVAAGNLAAFQFHPEKSGESGLKLLANFLAWKP
jgi:glutamine amidotransferase